MNTTKQINVMLGLLIVGLLGTFLYFLFDNGFSIAGFQFDGRENAAAARQESTNVERGAMLYARNCRACHGLKGEGALELPGFLPGADLNRPTNRPPGLKATEANARKQRISGTIHCGRVGTAMPPWSTQEGGPLNDFQIEQIVKLITSEFSLEGWEHAVEEGNHSDLFAPPKFLVDEIDAEETTLAVATVAGLEVTEDSDLLIRLGGHTIEEPYEVMIVTEVHEEDNTIEVKRGAVGSEAIEHEAGAPVLQGPIVPPDTITGAEGIPPCGQSPAQVPEGEAAVVEIADGAEIDMTDNVFNVGDAQNPTLSVAVNAPINVDLVNSGANLHNLRTTGADGEFDTDDDTVSDPEFVNGGEQGVVEMFFATAGTYGYRCDVHPDAMLGEITVE